MKIKAIVVALAACLAALLVPSAAFATEDTTDSARIHLIHGIPETDVDVFAGGEAVLEDFKFGDTFDLSSFAGATLEDLQVKAAGTDTVAIDAGDTALPAKGNFTIVAHLDAEGTPALAVFENDTSKIKAGEGRLTVRHAAAAPLVDVKANGAVAFEKVANGDSASADLAAGVVSAEVVPTGADTPVVIGPADLDVKEGESLVVYAVGSLEADSLTVLTETVKGLHSTPKAVHTGTSPVANSSNTMLTLAGAAAFVALLAVPAVRFASAKK